MQVKASMVATSTHMVAAPGRVECDCSACWQVRQLRSVSPVRGRDGEETGRRVDSLGHVGGML